MSRLVWHFRRCLPYQPWKTRVDSDGWLTSPDQRMYLRHVDRDGCVDLDLSTYDIGPQLAGRTVLFQVLAESHQFAIWHQEEARQIASYQRSDQAGDALARLSEVYPSLKRWLPSGALLPMGPGKFGSRL